MLTLSTFTSTGHVVESLFGVGVEGGTESGRRCLSVCVSSKEEEERDGNEVNRDLNDDPFIL
jgi:hypothetical protein